MCRNKNKENDLASNAVYNLFLAIEFRRCYKTNRKFPVGVLKNIHYI